jgi:hypothetical protein
MQLELRQGGKGSKRIISSPHGHLFVHYVGLFRKASIRRYKNPAGGVWSHEWQFCVERRRELKGGREKEEGEA